MKFKCRITRWSKKSLRRSEHKIFVWLPVRLEDGGCAWLESVLRKEVVSEDNIWIFKWTYRAFRR